MVPTDVALNKVAPVRRVQLYSGWLIPPEQTLLCVKFERSASAMMEIEALKWRLTSNYLGKTFPHLSFQTSKQSGKVTIKLSFLAIDVQTNLPQLQSVLLN